MRAFQRNLHHLEGAISGQRYDVPMMIGGFFVLVLLLVPYASNGFWADDALNSQVYYQIRRIDGGLAELFMFAYRVVKHWLLVEGRLMLGFFHGYAGFYFFHDLFALRLAQCTSVLINIALYGYLLKLLGAPIRFLVVWAIILVGLFQIHGAGLDPVASFAFHYQVLGIQLTIVLILFVKWHFNQNQKYLYAALSVWLFFMLWYEVNAIFIPIAFAMMTFHRSQYQKDPRFLLILAACVYLGLAYYFRIHAINGNYEGVRFGELSSVGVAYLKQLSGTFPFASYLSVTHNSFPFSVLIKEAVFSFLAVGVFVFSFMIFFTFTSKQTPRLALKSGAFIISCGMFLLPAIFPAISLRYQVAVGWGISTLPVYYQCFGLAFFLTWAISVVPIRRQFRIALPILISAYLALNTQINLGMVKLIDETWHEPRVSFAIQAQSGLFSEVNDGDIVHTENVGNFVNENLIFQWTGKSAYIPTGDHYWFPWAPNKAAREFYLSRSSTTDRKYILVEQASLKAEYETRAAQEQSTIGLENFPATLPLVEIQLDLGESKKLDAVVVRGLGEWTTRPVDNLWGVGILDSNNRDEIRNQGARKEKLDLTVDRELTLWISDNGSFLKCPDLQIELLFGDGKRMSAVAECKHK